MLLTPAIRSVFVTGAAGFIGSHVVDALLMQGYRVTAYDNLSSGRMRWMEHHLSDARFSFVKADLLDLDRLVAALAGHDLVWHLAANTDIPGGVERTDLDLKHCVIGTSNVLEAMRRTGVREMLFASTGAVYGELCRDVASAEDAGPLLPLSLYAAGKIGSEMFISAYCHLFDLRAWMFRFGNVIGSRMGHGVIFDFVQKLRADPRELEILGDGRQEKNYFLVEECIDGMGFAYRQVPMSGATPCDVFNLGTDSTTKVTTIAQTIIEEMGLSDVRIRFTGGERGWPGDQPRVHLSVEKMRRLGWQAKLTSDEAVRQAAQRLLRD